MLIQKVYLSETTYVIFRRLSDADIKHYLHEYKPFDKAGLMVEVDWYDRY